MAKRQPQIHNYRVTLRKAKRQDSADEPIETMVIATSAFVDSRGTLLFHLGPSVSYGSPQNAIAAFAPGVWTRFELSHSDGWKEF